MLRYLLVRHSAACFVAAFVAAMIAIRFLIAPAIVESAGLTGGVITIGAIFLLAFLLDRRT